MEIVEQRAQRANPAAEEPAEDHRQRDDDQRRPEHRDDLAGAEHGGSGRQWVETKKKVLAAGQLILSGEFRASEKPKKYQQQGKLGCSPPPSPGDPKGTP